MSGLLIYRPLTLSWCLFIFTFKPFFSRKKYNHQYPQKETPSVTSHHRAETVSLHSAVAEEAPQLGDVSQVSRSLHCGLMLSFCSSACLCDHSVILTQYTLWQKQFLFWQEEKELKVMEIMRSNGALDISALG